jgi:hypothetical protein
MPKTVNQIWPSWVGILYVKPLNPINSLEEKRGIYSTGSR